MEYRMMGVELVRTPDMNVGAITGCAGKSGLKTAETGLRHAVATSPVLLVSADVLRRRRYTI